ncbi:hypothetical protein B5F10_02515 [Anaerotruncus colihominis]|uniref:Uncharacterized protein n=1 Tax=Anaerotruncus colihominis TaxID=169435 RepID=A0A1Y4MPN2_9FIRM|nr:hypothetical protein [Anaerotruncus colihominis]OUP70633.1 hypothetical protein B5F11_04105 [Anaerotruncus colihominis]OUP76031.1 hypothetical protein B5F10_02515 [Anaerotruncus colihominis]
MKIRNVVLFTDTDSALLGGQLEVCTRDSWVKKTFSFRDVIASDFVFSVISSMVDIVISGVDVKELCLIYPICGEVLDNRVKVVKLPGSKLSTGFDAGKVIAGITIAAMFVRKALPDFGDSDSCKEYLTKLYLKVEADVAKQLEDARGLKLLRRPEDKGKAEDGCKSLDRYFMAMEVDCAYNTAYVQGTGMTIKKSDLIMPYNEPLLGQLTGDVVNPWMPSSRGEYSKIGPQVNIPIPRWNNFVAYFENMETSGEQEQQTDADEEQNWDIRVFRDKLDPGSAEDAKEDSVINYVVSPSDIGEVDTMIEMVDFTVEKQDALNEGRDGGQTAGFVFRIAPIHPEAYHIDELSPKFADSFDYENLVDDPDVNVTNAPIGYIRGFESANKVPLLPRERYWYEVVSLEVRDSLMYENACFSVEDAEQMVKRGERSRYANTLLRQMIEPAVQITRGFTGRAAFNGAKYFRGSTDNSEDGGDDAATYDASWACFFTIRGGRLISIPIPKGYSPTDFGQYRSMVASLFNFVDAYVRDTYGLVEILLRLLRDRELKPTMLVLDAAFKEQKAGKSPIYFDLLEARNTEILGGIDNLTPSETQDMTFGIRLASKALSTVSDNYAYEMQSNALGDDFRYKDGYIVGVGIWSSMKETDTISKIDFMDIFTLVDMLKEGRNLASVPISLNGIKYDKERNLFIKEIMEEDDIDNVLAEQSSDGMCSGWISLDDAMNLRLFETKDSVVRGRHEKEIRSVLEPIQYIKARADAAKATGVSKLAQEPEYKIFTQLGQLSNEPKRIDTSINIYNTFSGKDRIPAALDQSMYIRAMLDVSYTVKFIKFISYCVNRDILPTAPFADYLNAVNDFMSHDDVSSNQGQNSFKEKFDQVRKWFQVIHNAGGKSMLVLMIGEMQVGQKLGYVLIENTAANADLIKAAQEAKTFDGSKKFGFLQVYNKIIRPRMNSSDKTLFMPTEGSMRTITSLATKLGG